MRRAARATPWTLQCGSCFALATTKEAAGTCPASRVPPPALSGGPGLVGAQRPVTSSSPFRSHSRKFRATGRREADEEAGGCSGGPMSRGFLWQGASVTDCADDALQAAAVMRAVLVLRLQVGGLEPELEVMVL